jgi:hypothetical protein
MTLHRLDLMWSSIHRSIGMPHRVLSGEGFKPSRIGLVVGPQGLRVQLRTGDTELALRPGLEHAAVAQFVALTREGTWRTTCRSNFCSEFPSQPG